MKIDTCMCVVKMFVTNTNDIMKNYFNVKRLLNLYLFIKDYFSCLVKTKITKTMIQPGVMVYSCCSNRKSVF